MKSLHADQLRKTYSAADVAALPDDLPLHRKTIIGQDRAVRALKFGLGNRGHGFNVYVSAPDGDRKINVVRQFLEALAQKDPAPPDWCYVNNFQDPYCPKALRLPNGRARKFKADTERFISDARISLVKTFESEEYAQKLSAIEEEMNRKQREVFSAVNDMAKRENFIIRRTPMEIMVIPKVGEEEMTQQQFQALGQKEQETVLNNQREIQSLLQTAVRKAREVEKETTEALLALEQKVALFAIEDLLEELLKEYENIPQVPEHFQGMKTDILENLGLFLRKDQDENNPLLNRQKEVLDLRYEVNIVMDNSGLQQAPIVVELNPTYYNLFGRIERESEFGTLITNFTLIRAGALHKANGGYLILPVDDLLMSPFSWDNLKRALRNGMIEIEDPTQKYGYITGKSLQPQPIALDTQIILVGRHYLLNLLYQLDDDFRDLFKVKADFDDVMPANQTNLGEFCSLMHSIAREEGLLPVSEGALASLVEYGHRLAEHQEKVSTRFSLVADLLREAQFYARENGEKDIQAAHIRRAIREKVYRSDLVHEKIRELIKSGVILIDLDGAAVGQVNGLSYLDMGDIAFGQPSRITASISVGKGSIIDIEREAKLSGPIHSKGVMILTGFFFDHFGHNKPLSLSARLVFEQNYGGIDGDSASSTELYAILSRLANVPIKQGIAVTGSVNQKGEVQAVGGINEKIEGFFEVCRQAGWNGEKGVMIPRSNVPHLMLKEEVLEAVEKGQFKVWAVSTIAEGIEILTGMKAGERIVDKATGQETFEPDSIYARADEQLCKMAEELKKFAAEK